MYKSVLHDGIGREELRTKEFIVSHLFLVAPPFSGIVYRFSWVDRDVRALGQLL